jgi:hypothetical protein
MYQPTERVTAKDDWHEDELRADVHDMCIKIMTPELLKQYEYRALRDEDLLKSQYMAEHILSQIDVIELFDTEYDKHNNEGSGIEWYDKAITIMINTELKENLMI